MASEGKSIGRRLFARALPAAPLVATAGIKNLAQTRCGGIAEDTTPPAVRRAWQSFHDQFNPIEKAYYRHLECKRQNQEAASGHLDLDLMALRSVPLTQKIRMQRDRDAARQAELNSTRNRIMRFLGLDTKDDDEFSF